MFEDRYDAAMQLVPKLKKYAKSPNAVILAIPRGGLELGYILARELHLPLDVIFIKKIGYPGNPEYAIGAVSLHHIIISSEFTSGEFKEYIDHEVIKIRKMLQQRSIDYRGGKPVLDLTGKTVIVVDDGVATGSTLLATLGLIEQENIEKIVVALPVASAHAFERIRNEADEVICLEVPQLFFGVGQFYRNFNQVDDAQAIRLLHEANE